jgi:hypothetical protein
MPDKPSSAHNYTKENVDLVRQTCLYVATKLGDLLDELVVVGALVPSLLIPDETLPAGEDAHIGTMDLDLGLSLKGFTLMGEKAERQLWVCGPGAFIVLKALAFHQRCENKDVYDLYFVIRNHPCAGGGVLFMHVHFHCRILDVIKRHINHPSIAKTKSEPLPMLWRPQAS